MKKVHIIGGGLAGSEAAWQILTQTTNVSVTLHEMRPIQMTQAHKTEDLAELVCSNSLKSEDPLSAPGILKEEMRSFDSLILKAAEKARVPAGKSLSVDRLIFSQNIKEELLKHPKFVLERGEISEVDHDPDAIWVIATGPLTSSKLAQHLKEKFSLGERLYFYDSIAPVLALESIDQSKLFWQSRYEEEEKDYLNIPLTREEYETFVQDLLDGEKSPLHDFEEPKYFEACLPIEVMASRGKNTLRFGPLKPMGLTDPQTGKRPYAAIQLRLENQQRTMVSMVGLQTKLKWPEQKRIFSKLPGLTEVDILRYGSIHRNTYFECPKLISEDLSLKADPRIFLAGQITGVEGYLESAAIGLLVGRAVAARINQRSFVIPTPQTVIGSLAEYIRRGVKGDYAPMNANWGLVMDRPVSDGERRIKKQDRKLLRAQDTIAAFKEYEAMSCYYLS